MKIKKINLEAFQGEELTDVEKQLIMAGSGVSDTYDHHTECTGSDHDSGENDYD